MERGHAASRSHATSLCIGRGPGRCMRKLCAATCGQPFTPRKSGVAFLHNLSNTQADRWNFVTCSFAKRTFQGHSWGILTISTCCKKKKCSTQDMQGTSASYNCLFHNVVMKHTYACGTCTDAVNKTSKELIKLEQIFHRI